MTRERLIGWTCATLLLVVWASFHLMSRLTTQQSLTAWDVAALRFAGAFLTVLPIALWRGWPRVPPRRVPAVLVFAGFGFPFGAYLGYQFAPAAHGATVMAAGLPVMAALLGWAVSGQRITRRRAISLAIVVAGSLLLAQATSGVWAGAWRGDLLFLAAVSSWAVYTVLVQRWGLAALDVTLLVGLLAAPVYLPVWRLFLPSTLAEVPWPVVLMQMAFQGALAAVLAGFLYTRALNALGPGPTTMIGAVIPGLAALLAWPLLGEALPPLGLVAVLLVSVGMVVSVVGPRRREAR